MALYEYFCTPCQLKFEQITRSQDPDQGRCPKCESNQHTQKLISLFAVGGRGDLRESTLHGCHDCNVSPNNDGHFHPESDSHSHDSDS